MTHPIRRPATPTHPITLTTLMLTALLLTSCTPPTPTPSTPKYDHTCHTEDQQTEYPCTTEQHQQMLHQDALYTEAEDVYHRHTAELFRISKSWELSEVTPVIEDTSAGIYLELVTQRIAENRADRVQWVSGEPELVWVKRYPNRSSEGSIVALWTCMDGSKEIASTIESPNGSPGIVAQSWVYFNRIDGALKLWDSEVQLVGSC